MTAHNDIPCEDISPRRREKRNEFISVRVSPTTKIRSEALAKQQERTLSWLVNKALIQFLDGKL